MQSLSYPFKNFGYSYGIDVLLLHYNITLHGVKSI